MRIFGTIVLGLSLVSTAVDASAQARVRQPPLRRANAAAQDKVPAARRRVLEQQIRQRLWQVTRNRLALSDDQMSKLEQLTTRFDQRRRQLGQVERTHRQALRAEILADSSANQSAIASALEGIQQVQRQRIDMQVDEQKELATFMTPLQRAKFLALQEEFRKRMQELVRARPDSAAAPVGQSP